MPRPNDRIVPRSKQEEIEKMNDKPKVMATGIAGVAGALAVWAWNTAMDGSSWQLDDPVNGLAVTFVAFIAGPALRWWERNMS